VARLGKALEAQPNATRFIVHGDHHPHFEELVRAAWPFPVSVVATPVRDTCKEVLDGVVRWTVARESLLDAVGPWVFSREGLVDALSRVHGIEDRIAGLLDLAGRIRVRALIGPWTATSVWPPP
jgi:2-C-methyl-D-erythritol 4-phosphate cytidylyltransferase